MNNKGWEMKLCTALALAMLCMSSVTYGQMPSRSIEFDTQNSLSAIPVSSSSSYGEWFNSSEPSNPYPSANWNPWTEPQAGAASGAGPGGSAATEGGGGAGAGDAVNPGAPLSQIQFQNVFVPESYEASGYSNQFIVQPVFSVNRKPGSFFEYHVVRPTLPILEPNPDPDGPIGDIGGIGDLTLIDVYVHETEKKGLIWGVGPVVNFPTSSNRQTGLGEWQLGPAFAVVDSSKKNWVFAALFEVPFSLESDAYNILFNPGVTRLLPNDCYIGTGDLLMKLDDQNGNYNIPLSFRVGKVFKFGKQPINIFVQPQYTPSGFTSQPSAAQYGVKLNCTFLLPGAEFGYSKR
jgi:hypothetical protein